MDSNLEFIASSRCETGACTGVALTPDAAHMRDTKDDNGPILTFDANAWNGFIAGIRGGDFNRTQP